MSKLGKRMISGLKEALAIARGKEGVLLQVSTRDEMNRRFLEAMKGKKQKPVSRITFATPEAMEAFIKAGFAGLRNCPKEYFAERAARADIPKAIAILKRAGVGKPPMKGDEIKPAKRKRKSA